MSKRPLSYEQETIINFNKEEKVAYIFTYEKTWQKHLENKLGLKPKYDNGIGGREYELPKSMIKPPRARRRLSDSTKNNLVERLHRNRVLSSKNACTMAKPLIKIKQKGNLT